jgi:regulator of sigma E protease
MSFLVPAAHYLLTILGIALVIFVHELGHFLAARAVGIRVEAFSIGFGPRLFGFRRGDTDYKVCLIPLGGFVKMAGEDPTTGRSGKNDEFGAKTVPQRILVIVAGVVMNVVFAIVAVPIAFMMGVPFEAPIVGATIPGGAAWRAGIRPGDRLRAVDGTECLSFEDAATGFSTGGAVVRMAIERDGRTIELDVPAEKNPALGRPALGVRARPAPFVLSSDAVGETPAAAPAARHRAAAGLRAGDEIVAIDDFPFAAWRGDDLQRELTRLVPRRLAVRRAGALLDVLLPPSPMTPSETGPSFGVESGGLSVAEVLPETPAAALGLRAGDRLTALEEAPVASRAELVSGFANGAQKLTVVDSSGATRTIAAAVPDARRSFVFDVRYELAPNVLAPVPGGPAALAGIRSGDVLTAVDGRPAVFADLAALPAEDRAYAWTVRRNGVETTLAVRRGPTSVNAAFAELGAPQVAYEIVRTSFAESWAKGAAHTVAMTRRVLQTLRSLVNRRVSAENLGGIITIFRSSVASSEIAPSRGILFLAFISLNLAVLNILPIPVLDGGWLLLLLLEAVRKKPLSERATGVLQWIGFLFVMGLMVFVTWNDLVRLFRQKFG